ncbi:MAG: helix-turn-helix transcriptional regulator [Candidatus Doudnabacteria bacterium]|nr:helix-turn-helix transcriptional regulator [Candidatus Doudnabacteria bacterium]
MINIIKLKKELSDKQLIARCAKEFGVVGDATRMKICYLLCHHPELTVSEIAQACGLTVSAASHALKKLRSIGLVQSRRQFRSVFYRLSGSKFSQVIKQSLERG